MTEYIALIIVNVISLPICIALTISGLTTARIAYHLLATNPEVKNEDSNRFFYGRWRKIGGIGFLFLGLAFLIVLLNWLVLLHIVASISYLLIVIWAFKRDDGRLANRVIRDIP